MKLLITGGAGFIGSAVIRHIIKNTRDEVVNLDKLTYAGNLESLLEISDSERYAFEKVDICDRAEVDRVLSQHKPDAIMHLAAESHVDRSIDGPAEFIQTNIVGTYTLLEAARQYWQALEGERKTNFRFHHISTDEVYGDLPHPDDHPVGAGHARDLDNLNPAPVGAGHARDQKAPNPEHEATTTIRGTKTELPLFTEATPYAPSSPYSASKASSDHLVRAWRRTYGLPTLVTNCSNNYGPYHFPEKLIPLMILNALEGKPLPVYGNGDQIRDWLYVDDHARALYKVVTEGKPGETYNIGGHNEKKNIEVVHTICTILDELRPLPVGAGHARDLNTSRSVPVRAGHARDLDTSSSAPVGAGHARDLDTSSSVPVRAGHARDPNHVGSYKNQITNVKDRPGHDRRYAIDASKIQKELGWVPQETFETGIRKTVEWYLNNLDWCQRVQDGSYLRERLGTNN